VLLFGCGRLICNLPHTLPFRATLEDPVRQTQLLTAKKDAGR
jgi:hypothetical protein